MTRNRWLTLGVFVAVAVTAVVLSQRRPARIAVDTVAATRQTRFVSTVTASGEIVATRYADIGSSVMEKIVSLPVAEGDKVTGRHNERQDWIQSRPCVMSDIPTRSRTYSFRGRTLFLCFLLFFFAATSASAQTSMPGRIGITLEGLNVWQQRNDVRIPPATGTEFSLVDLVGSAPTPSLRLTATADVSERQQVRFVYAPLQLSGRGTPAAPIVFAGTTFAPAPTEAIYKFSSYRVTWNYRVHEGPTWTWRIGFTGFVRDARIALTQIGAAAEDTDIGFVPLGHVSAGARLSPRWSASFVADASAAPQGRAIDFAATLEYRPAPRWMVFGGYRTIEGGADVDSVYAFAWLNSVVSGISVRF
jgi:hypothetical protein